MKEKVGLSLDKDLLQKIDRHVNGKGIKDRAKAIELLIRKALNEDRPKTALILAGGMGTRLKPITHEIPKPLVPIQGKPILEHNIDLMRLHGITDIIISVGYKGQMIRDYFGDGRKFGVNIFYVEEKEPLGTAGPLRLAEALLTDSFVYLWCDELKDIDLFDMYRFHKDCGGIGTIALTTVDDPSSYGVVKLVNKKIEKFVEKPKKGEAPSNLINAGLFILEPEIIALVPPGPCSIEKEVFPKLAERGKLFGYPFKGQWFDTGTLERYETAIHQWKGFSPRRTL